MKHFTAYHMLGFNDQLHKEAAAPAIVGKLLASPSAKRVMLGKALDIAHRGLSSPGVHRRMLGTGAVGAGVGAATGEEGTRLQRALAGGLIGAGAGGASWLATKPGREAMKRFGVRQRYYLTGKGVKDKAHAKELGILDEAPKIRETPAGFTGDKARAYRERAEKVHAKEMGRHQAKEKAFEDDIMSLPGMGHAILSGKGGELLRSGWKRSGPLDKAFLGLGGLEMGRAAITPTEEGGPGRAQRMLRAAGQTTGWLAAPHAMLPGVLAGAGAGAVGGAAGKAIDYGAGRIKPRLAPQESPLVDY